MSDLVRVAAVDCGTNSIRLLVADVDRRTGALTDVLRRMEIVRLGHGVDRTGRLDEEAISRTLSAVREYAAQCQALGATGVRFVATSASRDASNAADFVAGVREAFTEFGTSPEVITGEEEAGLSFRGATGDLVAAGLHGPYLVVDLGGGSTEFVRGTADVEASISVDIGCVRMTERYLHSDPPTSEEIAGATADIRAAVDRAAAAVDMQDVRALVGLAGSVTTVTAQALALPRYDPHRIHLAVTSVARMQAAARELLSMTRPLRAALPFMHPGRVDVIGAGALIWGLVIEEVAARSGLGDNLTLVSSEHDILDGMALTVALDEAAAQ
jgi:exopolyphosphatase / guanosine-5'-triphosphate,3'-diphosphate pyrophosphatase